METVCTPGGENVCESLFKTYTGPVAELCGPLPNATAAQPQCKCEGKWCSSGMLTAGDCCMADGDCVEGLVCNTGHHVCEPPCESDVRCPAEPKSLFFGAGKRDCDGYHTTKRHTQARPAAESASHSVRRALLIPLVNPGSLYRCGKRT